MATVLLCGSFPVLPKLARFLSDRRSTKSPKPSYNTLHGCRRAKPSSEKSEAGSSLDERTGVAKGCHAPV